MMKKNNKRKLYKRLLERDWRKNNGMMNVGELKDVSSVSNREKKERNVYNKSQKLPTQGKFTLKKVWDTKTGKYRYKVELNQKHIQAKAKKDHVIRDIIIRSGYISEKSNDNELENINPSLEAVSVSKGVAVSTYDRLHDSSKRIVNKQFKQVGSPEAKIFESDHFFDVQSKNTDIQAQSKRAAYKNFQKRLIKKTYAKELRDVKTNERTEKLGTAAVKITTEAAKKAGNIIASHMAVYNGPVNQDSF